MNNKTKESTTKRLDVNNILKELEESVEKIFSSEYYLKTYLKTYAQFHNYSYNNVIWILSQRPDASYVASYVDWSRKFNRTVKKGSKGIKVLVPIQKKYSVQEEVKSEDGSKYIAEKEIKKLYFKVGHVFDVADTEGQELPTLTHTLDYNSDFLKEVIKKIVDASVIPITIDSKDTAKYDDVNGYYIPAKNEIHVRADLPDLHRLKTIVHELSHGIQETEHKAVVKELDRNTKEVVAESTAYVVMRMLQNLYGMEEISSAEYSFGYIVGWSTGKELKELKATLQLISLISNSIFDWIASLEIQSV